MVYAVFFKPVSVWEAAEWNNAPPMTRESHLCDMMHAPSKTGADTLKIIDSQVARKGLTRMECVAGVGDGGGENEGMSGVHRLMEHSCKSYTRRTTEYNATPENE
jgi:hypothetical protein